MKKYAGILLSVGMFFMIVAAFYYLKSMLQLPEEDAIRITFDFGSPAKNRIAVLYFNNSSADPADEYLSDGLTEDIITRLSKLDGLSVASLMDVRAYKNAPVTTKQIGEDLNVNAVLEGSVRRSGTIILVNALLIDVATGANIWAERYERQIDIEDIFGLQNEIATKIVQAAKLNLTQHDRMTLAERPTVSVDAYEYYLKGKYMAMSLDLEANWVAIEMFRKAVEIDPQFAESYAGLGDALARRYFLLETDDPAWLESAEKEIQKSLAIHPELAEAYQALGYIYMNKNTYEKALEAYTKAVQLKPEFLEARIGLGECYAFLGQYDPALLHLQKALQMNPAYSYIYYAIAGVHVRNNQTESAIMWLEKAVQHGFDHFDYLASDPVFDPIREDSKYLEFLKQHDPSTGDISNKQS
ncbi:MAG: tetratricopeptide repeat protein [Chlamydiota bacterium]|nr:tetratricopeptide repeat protein [Chlamydiota bacterium]